MEHNDGDHRAAGEFILGMPCMGKSRYLIIMADIWVPWTQYPANLLKMQSRGERFMCNYYKNNFVDLCVKGERSPDDINGYVDEWHESSSTLAIYEYLGMTQSEYGLWVQNPDYLLVIINARVKNRLIDDATPRFVIQDLPVTSRAGFPDNTKSTRSGHSPGS